MLHSSGNMPIIIMITRTTYRLNEAIDKRDTMCVDAYIKTIKSALSEAMETDYNECAPLRKNEGALTVAT